MVKAHNSASSTLTGPASAEEMVAITDNSKLGKNDVERQDPQTTGTTKSQ
jgi:hypothetical protein